MTKTQIAALVAATGIGFTGGATFNKQTLEVVKANVVFIHALRVETDPLPDGGFTADRVNAWRTKVVVTVDGGTQIQEDLGLATCEGKTEAFRAFVAANCKAGKTPIRVIEIHPGAKGTVAAEIYNPGIAKCALPRDDIFAAFLDGLKCTTVRYNSTAQPL